MNDSIQTLSNQKHNLSKSTEVTGSVNLSINYLFSPGIYAIVNKQTDRSYIGEGRLDLLSYD